MLFVGQAQIMTAGGILPISFEIDATSLSGAIQGFSAAAKQALEDTVRELQELRRQASSQLVIPEPGTASSILGAGGGKIRLPQICPGGDPPIPLPARASKRRHGPTPARTTRPAAFGGSDTRLVAQVKSSTGTRAIRACRPPQDHRAAGLLYLVNFRPHPDAIPGVGHPDDAAASSRSTAVRHIVGRRRGLHAKRVVTTLSPRP